MKRINDKLAQAMNRMAEELTGLTIEWKPCHCSELEKEKLQLFYDLRDAEIENEMLKKIKGLMYEAKAYVTGVSLLEDIDKALKEVGDE